MAVQPHPAVQSALSTAASSTVQVGEIRPNDHLCFVFGDERERAAVTTTFVRDGLGSGDKVLYITEDDGPALARVLATLTAAGIDVAGHTAAGRLVVAGAEQTYLADGRFDVDRTVAMMDAFIQQTEAEGYRLLRVTGETGWVARHGVSIGELIAYEQAVSPLAVDGKVLALCQYDHRAFAAADMDALDRAHAGRAEENAVFEDGELLIRRRHGDSPGLGLTGTVGETGHTPLAKALDAVVAESAEHATDVHVDMSGLDFVDLEGLRLLVAARQELGDGRALHLERPAPHLRRLIRMAGWDAASAFRSPHPDFRHQACLYGSDAEFLATALPFVEEGFRLGEPVLAATTSANLELLSEALGERAELLDFAETAYFGRRPPQRIAAYERYWRSASAGTAARHVRILAEPVWAGRSAAEAAAWRRMEALLNALLGDTNIWMVCPYDTRVAPPGVLADARRTHPELRQGLGLTPSADYVDPRTPAAGPVDSPALIPPPAHAPVLRWDSVTPATTRLRDFVTEHAARLGLTGDRTELLVLALTEVARLLGHAAVDGPEPAPAPASLCLWAWGRRMVVELVQPGLRPSDSALDDPLLGYRLPRPDGPRPGEGLWLARQISESVEVRATDAGCVVRLELTGARALA
ncbi:anti-sigma factor RsbA family regulatory protein [Streptacidiphilus rugosus]|uniref:anti-sigma factor RsbA family regulatory protein n=1 Tax=Streptacidiphilus rugosus TaxID=405783 RepID=UPI00068B7542|nr:anti-sigma factor RsbA family regulatory protein [Streptacidiphilus rugosus]